MLETGSRISISSSSEDEPQIQDISPSLDDKLACNKVHRQRQERKLSQLHSTMSDSCKFRVAIIGGGIAGLAAAIALQKHDGIDVQLYEQATEIREVGASIALGPNGMRTLEKLGVGEALSKDIAFPNRSGYPMIYR